MAALAGGFLLPDSTDLAQPLWALSWPARATFVAVYLALRAVGADAICLCDLDTNVEVGEFAVQLRQHRRASWVELNEAVVIGRAAQGPRHDGAIPE